MKSKVFYVLLVTTLLAIPGLCWFGLEATLAANQRQSMQLRALHLVSQRATEGHLWFEEILLGDRHEGMNKVWSALAESSQLLQLLAQGGQDQGTPFPALQGSNLQGQLSDLQQQLHSLSLLAQEREHFNGQAAQAGSQLDQSFDQKYQEFIEGVGRLHQTLEQEFFMERQALRQLQWLLLGFILLLTGLVMLLVRRVQHQAQELVAFNETAKTRTRRFLADMAHEIRGPINIIHGSTQLLMMDDLPAVSTEKANMILGASSHLTDLLNEILDFSKIESGKLELHETPFALATEMHRLVQQCTGAYQMKGLQLTLDWDHRLPQEVKVDGLRLRQILLNLINNAWKFTEQGGATLEVKRIEQTAEKVWIRFSLQDTGVGVSSDAACRIFDAYAQAEANTTEQHGGTGLGLDIARRLARMMGGDLQLESLPGQGSRFFFTLGLEPLQAAPAEQKPPLHPLQDKEVMYVEDDPISREIVQAILGREGVKLTTSSTAEEALALMEEKHFHLILMDILLPGMDGIEATRRIRQQERKQGVDATPILALSVKAMQADQKAALAAGMDQFLSKPVPKKQLLFAITQALYPARQYEIQDS